ncbi:MAG: GTP cyclohydrolase I FolE [bacterium]|nr:GTP cyclohydrolase I FolE [bacterium]
MNGETSGKIASHYREIIKLLGEDPDRDNLKKTPERVAESLRFLTAGYYRNLDEVIGEGIFEDKCDEMILVSDIELYSLCEHHLLPFYGKAHVAYIPNGRIIGLSKIPEIVDVFARRLQVQERLTNQIADTIEAVLKPKGVGVVIEAFHLCMMMRGVQKQNSKAITSAMRGGFKSYSKTRMEFLRLIAMSNGSH